MASLGFLASSYSLFATGIIWPALAYVYPHDKDTNPGVAFDLVTLSGIIVGMILFGHLADRVGRKRLYGIELMIIIIATIGIAFSSDGLMVPASSQTTLDKDFSSKYSYYRTMNVFDAVTTWRALLGVGIGAGRSMQNPLSLHDPMAEQPRFSYQNIRCPQLLPPNASLRSGEEQSLPSSSPCNHWQGS